ncbi:hypothetical protein vseg_007461 [Gypsophila vaccaria]
MFNFAPKVIKNAQQFYSVGDDSCLILWDARVGLAPVIKCPQQPEGYECGYYVMKWMYNITFYYSKGKEEDFEKIMTDSSMSPDDINEIKEVWTSKCIANM